VSNRALPQTDYIALLSEKLGFDASGSVHKALSRGFGPDASAKVCGAESFCCRVYDIVTSAAPISCHNVHVHKSRCCPEATRLACQGVCGGVSQMIVVELPLRDKCVNVCSP
jgi:hypothetical protein